LLEVKPDRYTTMTRAIPYTSAGYIGEGGANIPKINSTGLVYELAEDGSAYIPKYIDSAGREIGYEKTDQHLSYDIDDEKFQTIKSATVEYNADKGYYTVTMVADIEFKAYTTAETRWAITDSSATNDPHADFTKIEVKFELWDNGYFKKWEMRENWLAENAMPPLCFEMSAEQYYMEEFTYNEDDCDLTRFDFWNVQ
ncbi:MAG TPA: hypothetical protein VJZ69_02865, partial [Clostridia bacterium]|nr:hypothetical protein [Clostridia bacterium]